MRRFGPDLFEELTLESAADLVALRDAEGCLWVELTGLADTAGVATVGRAFQFHDLALEDVLDTSQRSKVEQYQHYTFVVIKALTMADHTESHQLCIFFGERFIVTVQDVELAALHPIRDRLRQGRGKLRDRDTDYLAYALIDSVIDHYFPVVEAFDDLLESVEDAVLEAEGINPVDVVRRSRQEIKTIRHAVWPARDVVTTLLRDDIDRIADETRLHLRDCYDHLVQLQDMIESSREVAASLLEAHISTISMRTNEVMRVLTVIATIFIPLTFVTGLYGMNFNPRSSPLNMPELSWYWGYPFSLLLMLGVVVGSLLYFRRKGWFGSRPVPRQRRRPRHVGSNRR